MVEASNLPLSDLRVIELGSLLAGPFCGQLLGDFGAEVIKLEDPGVGDPMRQWGREKSHGMSLWWPIIARNKKSVTTNLRSEGGKKILRDLISKADILLENFRPGTLEKWGFSPQELWEINPRLIITRVTGYGQSGPYSSRAGFGSIGEAMGGIRYVIGDADRAPSRAGISLGDSLAAIFATLGTLVAVHSRSNTGRGQIVDSAIYEAVLAMMESLIPEWVLAGYQRERSGSVLPNVSPSNVYPTAEGDMVLIAANQDNVFKRLASAMGQPELSSDARFKGHAERGHNMEVLDGIIAEWTSTIESGKLLDLLNEAGVPAGRIYKAQDMLEDPHFVARDAIVKLLHPQLGEFPMHSVFPKLSETPGAVRSVGPELGQHNLEVFGGLLGYGQDEIASLAANGSI